MNNGFNSISNVIGVTCGDRFTERFSAFQFIVLVFQHYCFGWLWQLSSALFLDSR